MTDTPDHGPTSVTIAFTDRETAVLEQIAKRQNITITAVVRAMVQRVIVSGPPKTRTPPRHAEATEAHLVPGAAAPEAAHERAGRRPHRPDHRSTALPGLQDAAARQEEPARPRPLPQLLRAVPMSTAWWDLARTEAAA